MSKHPPPWMPLVGIIILCYASVAGAGTITATLDGLTQYRLTDISYNGLSFSGALTGEINWHQTGGEPSALLPIDFHTFCIELTEDVWPGQTYTYQVLKLEDAPELSALQADAIRELWGRHYSDIRDDDTSAAFQIAIWEIVSDSGRKLNEGSFSVNYTTPTPPAYYTIAQEWLDSLDGRGPKAPVIALFDPVAQDQITIIPLASATCLALPVLGLLAARAAQRRRRSA